MAARHDFPDGAIVYCAATDQPFTNRLSVPAVAMSCYIQGKANDGFIGFECSSDAKVTRNLIIKDGFEFNGSLWKHIEEPQAVIFSPAAPAWKLWKIVSQQPGKLCGEDQGDGLPNKLMESVQTLAGAAASLQSDFHLLSIVASLHLEMGFEMQFWPFMTPYESVCYLFGQDRSRLIEQVECFYRDWKLPFVRLEA